MLEPLAARLTIDRLRRKALVDVRAPTAAGPERAHPLSRAARRVVRCLARLRPRGRMPAGAFELERAHDLTTSQLWSVWTVAHLESGLALRAWRLSSGDHRRRAHRAYRAALEREAGAARLLADRTAPIPVRS